jgi:ribosome biogenesis protein BRX1
MSFSILDNKVWIRNYQIVEGSDADADKKVTKEGKPISLVEIGPRFVLELIRVFDGSFGGSTLFENESYITPNNARRLLKGKSIIKHQKRMESREAREQRMKENAIEIDPVDNVFAES